MTRPNCPECCTTYVKRVRKESLEERLISPFHIYPFSCQLCGHRFKSFQWGARYLRREEDHRRYARLPLNFPATFTSGAIEGSGTIVNITMGGCAFRGEAPFKPGTIVRTSLQICRETPPIVVEAAIVRDISQNSVRVEFLHLKKAERDRLRDFICNLLLTQENGEGSEMNLPLTAQKTDHTGSLNSQR